MGRPLNKKYFGNKAAPYTDFQGITTPDSGTGSEGIASFLISGTNNNYTAIPSITISPPTVPGGVQAVAGQVSMIAKSATVDTATTGDNYSGEDYQIGDQLTVAGGTGTAAVFTVSRIATSLVGRQAAGQDYEAGNTITFSGAGWQTPLIITVTAVDGLGGIDTFVVTQPGVRTTAAPVDPLTGGTTGQGTGVDTNGTGATFNVIWGVSQVSLTTAGLYTALPTNPVATTTNSSTGGEGCTLTVSYGINSIAVATAGSGYLSAPTVTFSGNASATAVLTSSAPAAIKAVAYVDGDALDADIIKQVNDRSYKVETTNGVAVCELVTNGAPNAEGEMTIKATDSDGGTYFVAKLTSRKAILVPDTGIQFAAGKAAKWSLTTAIENQQVIIENV